MFHLVPDTKSLTGRLHCLPQICICMKILLVSTTKVVMASEVSSSLFAMDDYQSMSSPMSNTSSSDDHGGFDPEHLTKLLR